MVTESREPRRTGETQATGFQVGARRTFGVSVDRAWELVTSAEGMGVWLGGGRPPELEQGAEYRLRDGSAGEVRVVGPSHLRLTWRPKGWARASTVQVRVIEQDERAVIAFHQEHLPGAEERELRKAHYLGALDELERLLGSD